MGATRDGLAEAVEGARQGTEKPQVVLAADFDEAVGLAKRSAAPGDVVVLSPACASFDWFRNYEERGEAFRAAVLK
jgi:UDP-N-acetylmuramoylalanine--D-glutamate ligase